MRLRGGGFKEKKGEGELEGVGEILGGRRGCIFLPVPVLLVTSPSRCRKHLPGAAHLRPPGCTFNTIVGG